MKFVKFKNSWWQYDERTPFDSATIYDVLTSVVAVHIDIRDREIEETDSAWKLDWNGTSILDKNSRFGWVDRNGKFYGCDYASHDLQAQIVHKSSRSELEKAGWIHISSPTKCGFYEINAEFWGDYKNGVMPTDTQMEYLFSRKDVQFSNVMKAYEEGNREKARIYEANLLKKASKKTDKEFNM